MREGSRFGRRSVLRALGSIGVAGLAGCTGGGSDDDGDDVSDDPNGDADDVDDGDGEDDLEDGDGEDDVDDEEVARFGQSARFDDSYAFEMESLESEERFRSSGRVHGADSYMRIEDDGESMELYSIGDGTYLVREEGCFLVSGGGPEAIEDDAAEEPDVGTHEEEAEEHPELEAVGRETIDGEEAYVFELSASEAAEHDGAVTYYVSVETGYLLRVEDDRTVIDFHSWGEVDPIEPPEAECVEMGGWEGDDEPPARRTP